MGDTIQEGVSWQLSGDPSDLIAAFGQIDTSAKKTFDVARTNADYVTRALESMGTKAGDTGTVMSTTFDRAAAAAKSLQGVLADVSARYSELSAKADALRSTAVSQFQAGQSQTFGGILASLPASFAQGGAFGAGSLAVGYIASQVQDYTKLAAAADKAKISAQELAGIQSIFGSIGADGSKAVDIMTTFAVAVQKARLEGGEFADLLDASHIKLVDQQGNVRKNIDVFAEFARSIKDAGDSEAMLQAATAAVGPELAGALVDAVRKSETGFKDLAIASQLVGGAFTNDLAAAAQKLTAALNDVATSANGAYAQLRVLLGSKDALVNLQALEQNVRDAKDRLSNPASLGKTTDAVVGLLPGMAGLQAGATLGASKLPIDASNPAVLEIAKAQFALNAKRAELGLPPLNQPSAATKKAFEKLDDPTQEYPGYKPVFAPEGTPVPVARDQAVLDEATEQADKIKSKLDELGHQIDIKSATGPEKAKLLAKDASDKTIADLGLDPDSDDAKKIADLTLQLQQAHAPEKEKEKKVKTGKKPDTKADDDPSKYNTEITDLQRQLDITKATDQAKRQLEIDQDVENAQKKAGLAIDESTLKLSQQQKDLLHDRKQQIETMVTALDHMKDAQKKVADQQAAMNSLAEDFSNSIANGVANANSLNDILSDVLKTIETQAITGALSGTGPLAALLGTKDSGGLLGFGVKGIESGLGIGAGSTTPFDLSKVASQGKGLFAGLFADGGTIPSGKFGIVGERGPEIIVGGATGSRIIPSSQIMMGGDSKQVVNNHFYVTTPDAGSFARSQAQIGGMLTRAAQQGSRNS